ncbi:MAG: chorismate mutase [Synechococcus sp.]|nr:chorismate mutase [Synechococcus sp.]
MEILKPYRKKIDDLDDRIVDLLVARTEIIREVALLKHHEKIPAVLQDRVDEVRERAAARAAARGLDPDLVRRLYAELIDYSCNLEDEIMGALDQKDIKSAARR